MTGIRISVAVPDADANLMAAIGPQAERSGVYAVWIGSPNVADDRLDDTYVMTTLAAVAARTSFVRLGAFVALSSPHDSLRLAEDVGSVDQASNGRLELGLVAPETGAQAWVSLATQFLGAWNGWRLPDGDLLPVVPAPVQPSLPRIVAGTADARTADHLRAGLLVRPGDRFDDDVDRVKRRTLLAVEPDLEDHDVTSWLGQDVHGRVHWLRRLAKDAMAHEVLFVVPSRAPDQMARDVQTLGAAIAPALRCADREVDSLTTDSWQWLETVRQRGQLPVG